MNVDADTAVTVTFFVDYAAATKCEQVLRLGELAEVIRAAVASDKGSLPWLKMARFGTLRNPKGSLRHDRNVIAITGIEADFDGEQIACEQAVEIAEQAGLGCIIYASPSHTASRPRWRVLCPTSTELRRDGGRTRCRASTDCSTGSSRPRAGPSHKPYYFGAVNGNPGRCVHVFEGAAIDELDALALIAIGSRGSRLATGRRASCRASWTKRRCSR